MDPLWTPYGPPMDPPMDSGLNPTEGKAEYLYKTNVHLILLTPSKKKNENNSLSTVPPSPSTPLTWLAVSRGSAAK